MDFKLRQSEAAAGPGKAHIDSLKQIAHSVKHLPSGLYGITSDEYGQTHVESARIFLQAGAGIVQYRAKKHDGTEKPVREMLAEAAEIRKLCTEYGAIFIVDDRVDVANASGADGVHLGQSDMPIEEAKKQFRGIIGISAKTPQQALDAEKAGAHYIGSGAVFPTNTKDNAPVIGIDGLDNIIKCGVKIPVYAIGGIKLHNLGSIKKSGSYGIAVISGVLAEKDPIAAGKAMINLWVSR